MVVCVVSKEQHSAVMEHVKEGDLPLLVPQDHKYSVQQLIPLGNPKDEYCMFQNWSSLLDAEHVCIVVECEEKTKE